MFCLKTVKYKFYPDVFTHSAAYHPEWQRIGFVYPNIFKNAFIEQGINFSELALPELFCRNGKLFINQAITLKGSFVIMDVLKPHQVHNLVLRVAELLKRANPEKESTDGMVIDNYLFLPKRQELKCGDAVVKLSHKEALLLALLLQHKNRVLNKKETLLELWGDDNFFNGRTMDVYITKLRKKLKADPQLEILNIRGYGYKLIC